MALFRAVLIIFTWFGHLVCGSLTLLTWLYEPGLLAVFFTFIWLCVWAVSAWALSSPAEADE